jgi:hypothetical protein
MIRGARERRRTAACVLLMSAWVYLRHVVERGLDGGRLPQTNLPPSRFAFEPRLARVAFCNGCKLWQRERVARADHWCRTLCGTNER